MERLEELGQRPLAWITARRNEMRGWSGTLVGEAFADMQLSLSRVELSRYEVVVEQQV